MRQKKKQKRRRKERNRKMKQLKEGFTTGSCAAAASLASVIWQTTGTCPSVVEIDTPIKRILRLSVHKTEQYGKCYVIKDAGDDPDVTHGCHVESIVEIGAEEDGIVEFRAGIGIGIATQEGLKIQVGEPAINPIPRQMIQNEIKKIIGKRHAIVTISIPNGEELAKKTLNGKLGIIGGLSILGTTGIVRPMSEEALKDSLAYELQMRRKQGNEEILLVPGLAGERMARKYLKEPKYAIQMSNYVGFMLEQAGELGFKKAVLAGAVGKLMKLSAGIMNTHSHVADGRNEIICTHAGLLGARQEVLKELYESKTTEKAIEILKRENLMDVWQEIAKRGAYHAKIRTGYAMEVRVILFDKNGTIIGDSLEER